MWESNQAEIWAEKWADSSGAGGSVALGMSPSGRRLLCWDPASVGWKSLRSLLDSVGPTCVGRRGRGGETGGFWGDLLGLQGRGSQSCPPANNALPGLPCSFHLGRKGENCQEGRLLSLKSLGPPGRGNRFCFPFVVPTGPSLWSTMATESCQAFLALLTPKKPPSSGTRGGVSCAPEVPPPRRGAVATQQSTYQRT